jgi:hypothetical protein
MHYPFLRPFGGKRHSRAVTIVTNGGHGHSCDHVTFWLTDIQRFAKVGELRR